jgi:hypothetical protein
MLYVTASCTYKVTYLCIELVEYGNVMNQYTLTSLTRVGCFFQHQYWTLSSFLHLKYNQTFTASEVPCCLQHSAAYFWYIYTFTGRASRRTQQPVTLHSYCPLNFQGVAFPVHVLRSSWPVSSTDRNDILYVLLQIFFLVNLSGRRSKLIAIYYLQQHGETRRNKHYFIWDNILLWKHLPESVLILRNFKFAWSLVYILTHF